VPADGALRRRRTHVGVDVDLDGDGDVDRDDLLSSTTPTKSGPSA